MWYSIRIKSDLSFFLKKKWTRAKRDGGLSDPINHEVFGGDSLLPLACSIHIGAKLGGSGGSAAPAVFLVS